MLQNDLQLKSGVVGGTLFSTIINITFNDILFTIIMAAIGAVVSFAVSCLLRKLFSSKRRM